MKSSLFVAIKQSICEIPENLFEPTIPHCGMRTQVSPAHTATVCSSSQLKDSISALEQYLADVESCKNLAAKQVSALEALSRSTVAYADTLSQRSSSSPRVRDQRQVYIRVLCAAANTYLALSQFQSTFAKVSSLEFASINTLVGSYFEALAGNAASLDQDLERIDILHLTEQDKQRRLKSWEGLRYDYRCKAAKQLRIVDLAIVQSAANNSLALAKCFGDAFRQSKDKRCLGELACWRSSIGDRPLSGVHKSRGTSYTNLDGLVTSLRRIDDDGIQEMPAEEQGPLLQSMKSNYLQGHQASSQTGCQPETSKWKLSLVSELDYVASRLREDSLNTITNQRADIDGAKKDFSNVGKSSDVTKTASSQFTAPDGGIGAEARKLAIPVFCEQDYHHDQITDATSISSSLMSSFSSLPRANEPQKGPAVGRHDVADLMAASNWNASVSLLRRKPSKGHSSTGSKGLKSILGSFKKLKKSVKP